MGRAPCQGAASASAARSPWTSCAAVDPEPSSRQAARRSVATFTPRARRSPEPRWPGSPPASERPPSAARKGHRSVHLARPCDLGSRSSLSCAGTSFQARSLSLRTSRDIPAPSPPRYCAVTSDVPPSIELARALRKDLWTSVVPMPRDCGGSSGSRRDTASLRSQQIQAELVDSLVLLGVRQLPHRSFRTRSAGPADLGGALIGHVDHLAADPAGDQTVP